jgi:serine/threonine protein kinase/tetratricopeptide (TPR) repeat protein
MKDSFLNTQLDHWKITSLIGRGGMASVYKAQSMQNPLEHRAIKLLHTGLPEEEAAARFYREFRLLSTLNHPNIARVFDSGSWEDPLGEVRPWFSMELVEGTDLRAILEAPHEFSRSGRIDGVTAGENQEMPGTREPMSTAQVFSILKQTAKALEHLHLHGLVHRDISPGNLMMMPDGTMKLMDFGVVKESGLTAGGHLTRVGEFLGTAAWVSPEQIDGKSVDARADLYSLGAVLYLLLTGRRPFSSRTLAGMLEKHLHHAPRPPHELSPTIPPILENICLRLLEKEPERRIASATHLLSLLEADPPRLLPIAGRYRELTALGKRILQSNLLDSSLGGVILLKGAPGLGRTRLARLLVDLATRNQVLAIRTHAALSDLPLGAFGRLFDALSAAGVPGPARLAEAFRGGGVERHEMFSAYRQLLTIAGVRLLVLDDLQALDSSSWDLLLYLIRTTVILAEKPALWILTTSPDSEKASIIEEQFQPSTLNLEPLNTAEVAELLTMMTGSTPAPHALASRLHGESYGSPSFLAEMIHGLVHAGVLTPAPPGALKLSLELTEIDRSSLPIPQTVRAALELRIQALPPLQRRVAEQLAVASQELSLKVLESSMQEEGVAGALKVLVGSGLARERLGEKEPVYRLAQANLREILLEQLPAVVQGAIHRRLGTSLEQLSRSSSLAALEAMAWHFEHGESPGKAFAYLFRAGNKRLEQGFMADALGFFSRALGLEGQIRELVPLDEADRKLAELLLSRAMACDHLGRQAEAQASLDRAWALATMLQDARLQCRVIGELASRARAAGEAEKAFKEATRAIDLANNLKEPGLQATPLQVLAGLSWARGNLEEARRLWVELQSVGESAHDPKASAFAQNGLGLAALCKGQTAEARRFFEQSATAFEELGLIGPLSTVRGNLVEIHHFTGNLKRGLELVERSRLAAQETMNPTGVARSLSYKALILGDMEHLEESLEAAQEGLARIISLGDPSDELFARVIVGRSALALGKLEELKKQLDACQDLVAFDTEGFAPLLLVWRARISTPDQAAELLVEAQKTPHPLWPYQECRLDLALSKAYADLNNLFEAIRHAEAAVRRADACGFRLYSLKAHCLAAIGSDTSLVARHRRIAEGLARSLAASLSREDSDRFMAAPWLVRVIRS